MTRGWHAVAVLGRSTVAALVVAWLVTVVIGRITGAPSAHARSQVIHRHCRRAFIGLLVVLAWWWRAAVQPPGRRGADDVREGSGLCLIAAIAWLVVKVLFAVQDLTFLYVPVDIEDNRRARKIRTQISLLRSLTVGVVALLAVVSMLMTFGRLRTFGASLLASAGVVAAIVGVAAQATLRNVLAGLQLAFSDAMRIDDVVVVDGEFGRVEALNLMTVTLHLWDERRLVLPTSYFTTTSFQNWTADESRVVGSVYLHLDHSTPMPALRAKVREIVEASPLWDRRDWVVQVTDTTPATIIVRILASAPDAASSWDLRCDIREAVVTWLHDEHPEALPQLRNAPMLLENMFPDDPYGPSRARHSARRPEPLGWPMPLIPARTGVAVRVAAGQLLEVATPTGTQVVDFWAVAGDEVLSVAHTRAALLRLVPRVGDMLVTDLRGPMMTLVEDTSPGVHDTLVPACDPARYVQLGAPGHASCAANFASALAGLGPAADSRCRSR